MDKSKKGKTVNRLLSLLFCVSLVFFILTFSIGLPIYCRSFYFAHIEPLQLPALSGFTEAEIIQAYNEVLDYLTLPGKAFSAGVMAWSEEGKAHFDDCRILFSLNATVFLTSAAILAVLFLVGRGKGPYKIGKMPAAFYSGLLAIILPVGIGALASTDFDRAFVVFHTLFFPGKENWMFNPFTDEIINVLPQVFFRNCAVLIGVSIFLLGVACILYGIAKKTNHIK